VSTPLLAGDHGQISQSSDTGMTSARRRVSSRPGCRRFEVRHGGDFVTVRMSERLSTVAIVGLIVSASAGAFLPWLPRTQAPTRKPKPKPPQTQLRPMPDRPATLKPSAAMKAYQGQGRPKAWDDES
jgi:hypothetical protein